MAIILTKNLKEENSIGKGISKFFPKLPKVIRESKGDSIPENGYVKSVLNGYYKRVANWRKDHQVHLGKEFKYSFNPIKNIENEKPKEQTQEILERVYINEENV